MPKKQKDTFTTGEAAKVCRISQQTIIRCFDDGSLKGFRVPGSRFRRIPRNELYSFMERNKIPTDILEGRPNGTLKVLIVTGNNELWGRLRDALSSEQSFETHRTTNTFDAGGCMKEMMPDAIIIDCMDEPHAATDIANVLDREEHYELVRLFALVVNEGSMPKRQRVEYFLTPFDPKLLATRVRTAVLEAQKASG